MRLVVIGLVAGLFSALFGIGGGTVVVPLLILAAGFDERPAMATSLAAIVVIALVGAVTYALHGDVKPGAAAVVGIPAVAGVIAGAALQQRLATRTLSLAFAALLAAVGARLLV
ncbi:MAG: sulfite exporter TauE/SafE family protein [Gaiellaceae bacterium]